MDTVGFHFELRDLDKVLPWGNAESGLTLHWFGLTDGRYDMIIGEQRLYSGTEAPCGIDYQVARLWEDLIEVVPVALERVPEALAIRLADADAWESWVAKACDLPGRDELISVAVDWWFRRHMNACHLVGAPTLEMWRYGDELRIRWRTSPCTADGPIWSSPSGDAITPANDFLDELIRFDRDLIAAMHERVEAVEKRWGRPDVKIDVEYLRDEQADRETWLARALNVDRYREHTWDDVVDAVVELEREIGSSLPV